MIKHGLKTFKLQNLYGGGIDGTLINESIEVNTQWKDAQTRNELDTLNGIKIKVESLSISKQQAWREAGYTERWLPPGTWEQSAARAAWSLENGNGWLQPRTWERT